jgi:hypothetical protein
MQDNARVHTSCRTRAFLREHHIDTIDWPAYSPDLNPIEHLWWALKKRMYKFYPQYNNYSVAREEWDGFCRALKECWRTLPGALIRAESTPARRRMAGTLNTDHVRFDSSKNHKKVLYIGGFIAC